MLVWSTDYKFCSTNGPWPHFLWFLEPQVLSTVKCSVLAANLFTCICSFKWFNNVNLKNKSRAPLAMRFIVALATRVSKKIELSATSLIPILFSKKSTLNEKGCCGLYNLCTVDVNFGAKTKFHVWCTFHTLVIKSCYVV